MKSGENALNSASSATLSNFVRKPVVLLLIASVTLLTAILSAATTERFHWSREVLEGADGTRIEISYQTQPDGRVVRAEPLLVRVTGERLSGHENVKILFENYYLGSSIYPEQQQMATSLALSYSDEGEYGVDLGSIPIWYARDNGSEQHFRQQLTITVDGTPLRMESGETTFRVQLLR
jgi:hypothetical protein